LKLYLDSSVVVALIMGEPHAAAIVILREQHKDPEILVSDLAVGEIVASFAKFVRMGRIDERAMAAARQLLEQILPEWQIVEIAPEDVADAISMVARPALALRMPDAIHIALSRRLGAALVTLDQRQNDAAVTLGATVAGPLVGKA
jgi:predicted nucleic acid-binding protein